VSPLLLRLAALYGPKFIKLFAASMPVVKKVAKPSTKTWKGIADYMKQTAIQGNYSSKLASEADKLLKDYPSLFNSASKAINKAQSWKLAKALRDYKGPDMRKIK
tara:strand:- start:12925 stop:13239 length:315 start_codon:yes stop_codon:yes gene_type:complete